MTTLEPRLLHFLQELWQALTCLLGVWVPKECTYTLIGLLARSMDRKNSWASTSSVTLGVNCTAAHFLIQYNPGMTGTGTSSAASLM